MTEEKTVWDWPNKKCPRESGGNPHLAPESDLPIAVGFVASGIEPTAICLGDIGPELSFAVLRVVRAAKITAIGPVGTLLLPRHDGETVDRNGNRYN